jgi:hypothetical protein
MRMIVASRARRILALLCLSCSSAPDYLPELDIYVLAGQSNMSGRGSIRELPAGFPDHRERIFNYSNAGVWEPATPPIDHPVGQVDDISRDDAGVGPGLPFASRLLDRQRGTAIGLVPCAKGGSRIDDWARRVGRHSLYGSCIARVREAAAHGVVRGILWYQGESDTESDDASSAWSVKFMALVDALRQDLGNPDLPVVFAQLGNLSESRRREPRFQAWEGLKAAQRSVQGRAILMVRTDDLPLSKDGLHLATAAQQQLGARLADAMLRLLETEEASRGL